METRLTEMAVLGGQIREGHPLGHGRRCDSGRSVGRRRERSAILVRGRVLGGGIATRSRDMGLFIGPEDKSVRLAAQVGQAINRRFHTFHRGIKQGVANPKTDERIDLKVHPRYKDNIGRYIRVVRSMPLKESPAEQALRVDLLERQLLDPITAATAALRLEAIGRKSSSRWPKGADNADPEVRFYAAEALAYLDDSRAAAPLAPRRPRRARLSRVCPGGFELDGRHGGPRRTDELLEVASSETRYGAFRALWAMNPNDPSIRGENLGGQFGYHVLNTAGPPMIHVTRSYRPEVVVFGHEQTLEAPFVLEAGKSILVKGVGRQGDGQPLCSGKPDQKRIVSTKVDDVIRAIVELGGTYPDVVQALQHAKTCGALDSRFEVDALPDGDRTIGSERRGRCREPWPKRERSRAANRGRNPLPELFSGRKRKASR